MKDNERVIITAEYLIELFGQLDDVVLVYLLTPFLFEKEKAITLFSDIIAVFEKGLDSSFKNEAIDGAKLLLSGFMKMTVFEQESVRKHLPGKIVQHLGKERLQRL